MNCHDAREWLSDLLDDALATEARAQVDAHLAGCADCRRELDRLRATVSLLHAVEQPQAPAGFVDRVLAAARPAPWYRRLLDWLSAVRLLRFPVEAAAVVLVASLAVYVFQETPALRQAARPESPRVRPPTAPCRARPRRPRRMSSRTMPEGRRQSARRRSRRSPCGCRPPVPPAAPPAPSQAAPEAGLEQRPIKPPANPEDARGRGRQCPARVERRRTPQPAPSAPGAPGVPQRRRADPRRRAQPGGPERPDGGQASSRSGRTMRRRPVARPSGRPSQSPPAALVPAPAPEPRERLAREWNPDGPSAPLPRGFPPLVRQAPSAMRMAPSVQVVGRLTVKDRPAADRELAELLSRVGGAETARRTEAGGDTVDLVIPRAAYPAFAQGLARIGSWRAGGRAARASGSRPDHAPHHAVGLAGC